MHGDSVWVATASGLSRYSRTTRVRQENLGTQPPSSQGAVQPLALDAAGGVWWATLGGVYHRRPDRTVEVFHEDNSPLLSNDVHSVIVDHGTGDVWIGTIQGLNRLDPDGSEEPLEGCAAQSASSLLFYPNPAFLSAGGVSLQAIGVAGVFTGRVYDVRGRIVRHLLGNASTSGRVWDARDDSGRAVKPGIYFVTVQNGGATRTGRVLLMR